MASAGVCAALLLVCWTVGECNSPLTTPCPPVCPPKVSPTGSTAIVTESRPRANGRIDALPNQPHKDDKDLGETSERVSWGIFIGILGLVLVVSSLVWFAFAKNQERKPHYETM